MSRKQDNELRDAELTVLQIEKEIANLVRRLSAAPPDAVGPDMILLQRFTKFHLDRVKESLIALNHCILKAGRSELDQDALLALAQWT